MNLHIPNIAEIITFFVDNVYSLFKDLSLPQTIFYLASTYVIGFIAYIIISKGRFSQFTKDAFSKEIWLSKTAIVDFLFFFFFLTGISTGIVFGFDIVPEAREYLVKKFLPGNIDAIPGFSESLPLKIAWTLVFIIISDFLWFFIHWIEHKVRFFWRFHATHHSAKRLNPFVAYRLHPIESFLVRLIRFAIAPALFALLTYMIFGVQASVYIIYGVPIYFFIYYLYSNLRHTEIWVKFPRKLSYVFCSPAMHQIHHSDDPKWFGKNMSFIFSTWDWLFGTIYIPVDSDRETLKFGLPKEENVSSDSFLENVINPFINIFKGK